MVFVDTSAILAILDPSDINHRRSLECWEDLLRRAQPLLTNNYVLVESIAVSQKRFGMQAVETLQIELIPFLQVEWIDEEQHAAILDKLLATNQRKLSLVDCSAFETMRRAGVETVFTFDEHFRGEGFQVMP